MNPSQILLHPSHEREVMSPQACLASQQNVNVSQNATVLGEGFGEGFQTGLSPKNREKLSLFINTSPVPARVRAMRLRTRKGVVGRIYRDGSLAQNHPTMGGSLPEWHPSGVEHGIN